ncbi:hypothetical protein CO2235_140109 [Cupriavidus oxalaticus]|uniref:Uncharacterized protein n=1 Tax=Cupriavidus oxalaticus TaxID=96344 RepID=A0A375G2N0_9BURK|nr:hypothetical protein CO2235_140109 [Cupriavidus oxalaticus]
MTSGWASTQRCAVEPRLSARDGVGREGAAKRLPVRRHHAKVESMVAPMCVNPARKAGVPAR